MGINMDIRKEPKYSFLDLRGLDEAGKNEIAEILSLRASVVSLKLPWDIGEREYDVAPEVVENPSEDVTDQWQQYGMPEGMTSYEACEVQSAPMMTAAMTSGHAYTNHPLIYAFGDFSGMANPYGNSPGGDPNTYPFMQRIQLCPPPAMYPSSQPELMNQPPSRDNDRRGARNRGGKRGGDSYNRQMNSNNDIQPGYIVQGQPQYGQIIPMCHTSGAMYPVSAQSHPAAGAPIYIAQSPGSPYPQAPQMHHNNHPSYGHHQSSYPSHSHSTSSQKYARSSTGQTTYYNQESPKNVHKYQEKRMAQQDPGQAAFRHGSSHSNNNNNNNNINTNNNNANEVESPKMNYGKTMIVNNSNVEAKTSSASPRQAEIQKITMNHVKTEVTDAERIKDHDNNENKREKKEPAPPNVENNNAPAAVKEIVPGTSKEIFSPPEEKDIPVKIPNEFPVKPAPIVENTLQHVESNLPSKIAQENVGKNVESTTLPVTTTSSTTNFSSSPAPSTPSWANVLKKRGDPKSPTPIKKLPVTGAQPVHLSSPHVEMPNSKASTIETPPRKENLSLAGNRNSTNVVAETTTRNTDIPNAWMEKKKLSETTRNKKNDPAVLKMGELLSKYQMDKRTVSLMPRGLTNRSNYCYINSILQALLACPPFYNLLMALPYPGNPVENSSTPLIDNMVRFAYEFHPLPEGARMPRKDKSQKRGEETAVDVQYGVAFEPSYVYTMLKNTSCAGVFSVEGRQEDAEEFLSCLLNGISDEMLELMKLVNSESSDTASNPPVSNVNFSNAEEEWKVMGPKNKGSITRCTEFGRTPLSDIFRGQLRSRVSRTGDETTDNVQPFFTLQLDIEKAESVVAALEILVGKDQVEGMTCSKTKQQIEAWKQVLLEDLPVILILHLKWFDYKLDGCSKIFKRVVFPIDLKLDSKLLSPNVAKKLSPKQKQYKLFAVTYHDGKEASKGHYVTDAFHVGYNAWVRYDDSSVKGIYEKDVLNPTPPRVPYLLYYRRCDTIGNNPPITTRTR